MQSIVKPKRLAAFEDMIQSNIKTKILGYMTHQQIQPNYQEYLSLNTALQSGDAPMDKLLLWILQNPKQNRHLSKPTSAGHFPLFLFSGTALSAAMP